mmetsp:Transcript_3719/g.7831  ORF Transcript_3719/g.7831 Transcript_3719/m.7831 type:complete len:324 (-) Transcript_3719:504-1475(-)
MPSADETPLSKSTLYQALPTPGDGRKKKKISDPNASAQSEYALIDFLHQLSANYGKGQDANGGSSSSPSFGAYLMTGKRAVTRSEFAEKLQGRALTLVGGGFSKNTAVSSASAIANKNRASDRWNLRGRKRKRMSASNSNNNTLLVNSSSVMDTDKNDVAKALERTETATDQMEFLNHINTLWNEYASKILLLKPYFGGKEDEVTKASIPQLDRSMAHRVEWVGAKIRVESCQAYPSYVGRMGIVLAITRNTWCIIFCTDQELATLKEDKTTQNRDGHATKVLKAKYLPKQGSSLSALVNTSNSEDSTKSSAHIAITLNLEST